MSDKLTPLEAISLIDNAGGLEGAFDLDFDPYEVEPGELQDLLVQAQDLYRELSYVQNEFNKLYLKITAE